MICNKCFAEIPEDSKICPFCGEAVEAPAAEAAVAAAEPVAEPVAAPAVAEEAPAIDFAPPAEPVKEKKAKKGGKKKWLAIGIPVVAVITAAAVLIATNFSFVKGLFIKWFSDDSEYVTFVETENMKNATSDVVDLYRTFYDNLGVTPEQNVSADIEITVGDDLKALLNQYVFGSANATHFNFFQKANLKMNVNSKDGNVRMEGFVGINGTDIISANVIMDAEGNMYMQLPDLSSKYLYTSVTPAQTLPNASVSGLLTTLEAEDLKEYLPEPDVVESVLNRYISTVLDCVEDVESESVTLTVDGVSQDCTAYTIEISQRLVLDMAIAALESAQDDEEIVEIAKQFCGLFVLMGRASSDEVDEVLDQLFEDGIEDAIDELEDYREEASRQTMATLTDYVDGSHNIIGRSLDFSPIIGGDEAVLNIFSIEDGDDYGMKLEFVGPYGVGFCMKGTGTKDGDLLNLKGGIEVTTAAVAVSPSPETDITYETVEPRTIEVITFTTANLDTALLKDGVFKGTITVAPGDDLLNMLTDGEVPASVASLLGLKLEIVGNNTAESVDTTLSLLLSGKNAVSIRVSGTTAEPKDVAIPSKGDCIDANSSAAVEAWMQEMDPQVIADRLEQIGFPIDALTQGGMSSAPSYDYNY